MTGSQVAPAAEVEKSYEAMIRLSIVGDKNYPRDSALQTLLMIMKQRDSVLQTLLMIMKQIRGDARLDGAGRSRLLDRATYWWSVVYRGEHEEVVE